MNNVGILIDQVDRMLNRQDDPEDEPLTLQDAITRLVLRDIMDQQEEDDSDQVHLLTLHASKGLNTLVFILGLEEEILPHRNSIEGITIEEERRLFYVRITRAKHQFTHDTLPDTQAIW